MEEGSDTGSSSDSRSSRDWQSQSAASTPPLGTSSSSSSRPPSPALSSCDPGFDFEHAYPASEITTYAPRTTPAHAPPWRSGCCSDPSNFGDPAAAHRLIPNLYPYMKFKRDALHDMYNCDQGCRLCPVRTADGLLADPTERVVARAANEAGAMLELAVRFATGCQAPFDPQAAVLLADMVLKRHASFNSPSLARLEVSDGEHDHAHTVAALSYLLLFRATVAARPDRAVVPADLEDSHLRHAFEDAHAVAVSHGYQFAGALEVVEEVVRVGARLGVSEELRRGKGWFAAKKHRGLWRAYDVWRRVVEKVGADPRRYECARPGCGYRAMKAQLLKRCGGACAGEGKVGYCGRDCQRLDWQNHKSVCGPRKLAAGSAASVAEAQNCARTAHVKRTGQADPCST